MIRFLFLLLGSISLNAQSVFEKSEVDRPAAPIGGQPVLIDFITQNIRPPFENSVSGAGGRVEIKGVIETDGSASSLEIVTGANRASDEEMLRIFRLFKAWEPAMKAGEPVRQRFTYSLQFPKEKLANFDAEMHGLNFYFDKKQKPVASEDGAEYWIQVHVDQNGVPGDWFSFVSKKKKLWENREKIQIDPTPLTPELTAYLLGVEASDLPLYLGGAEVYVAKAATEPFTTGLPEFVVTQDRRIVRELLPGVYSKVYYASGQVAVARVYESPTIVKNLSWYPDSKPKGKYYTELLPDGIEKDKIISVYDSSGKAIVVNGNGEITRSGFKWGTGKVENGFLSGIWTIVSPSGTDIFKENYVAGKFVEGKRQRDGKTTDYSRIEEQPDYKGGMSNVYKLLSTNVRYPSTAAASKIQGKVVVSFFVETDGTITDLKIDKSVAESLDLEAMRAVGYSSGSWIPGKHRGVPVRMRYTLPVNFQLE